MPIIRGTDFQPVCRGTPRHQLSLRNRLVRLARHDAWVQFRETHRQAIVCTGLPDSLFQSEDRLIRFLSHGNVEGERVDLRQIDDECFRRLEDPINAYFYDGWEQASWTVLQAERFRRFRRYA